MRLNFPQRIVLGLGAAAIAAMTLFPPWVFVFQHPLKTERFAGYYPIWRSNTPTDLSALLKLFGLSESSAYDLVVFSIKLDVTRLSIQIVGALLITVLLAALLRTPPERSRSTS